MSVFIQIEGIKGETSDAKHKDWIDVESWRWGSKRKITSKSSTRKDRESASATITDLHITKFMDSASPQLFMGSCCGKGQNITLCLAQTGTGTGSDVFMEYHSKMPLFLSIPSAVTAKTPTAHGSKLPSALFRWK